GPWTRRCSSSGREGADTRGRGSAQPYSPLPVGERSRVRVALNHLRGTQPRMKSPYVPTKHRQLTPGPTVRGGKAMGRISEWLLDPKTRVPLRFLVDAIKEVEVLDALTARFVLSRPSPMLLSNLTYTTTAILSPAAAAKIGAANLVRDATAAGTGPYLFKEWVRGTSILVTRNPAYWGKAPAFDEVMFRV